MPQRKTVWIVAGPTASGKSQLALELGRSCEASIINADSMQIYSEIPVLSAQPSPGDQRQLPHLLYGFQSIAKHFSAAQWAQKAVQAIDDTLAQNRQPVLVGGSGLYLKALLEGFSPIPDVPAGVRKHVTDLYDMLGPTEFHDSLKKIDPVSAARLNPADRQRCIRAREVYEVSNEPLSAWQERPKQNIAPHLEYRSIVLLPDREWLYERINTRFTGMVRHGAIDEAKQVDAMDPSHDLTGTHALGLQALRDHLDGRLTLQEAVEQGQSQSRQYAKRQYTWFRNQLLPDSRVLSGTNAADWLALSAEHLFNG